jgi:hypothetical protein
MDQSFQSFKTCIDCHENRSRTRNCNAPVQVLKSMRDNHIDRRGAGISASTLISCPRAVAIEATYDLYMPVISGWNMGRGTFIHAMFEADRDPPPWIIRERRLRRKVRGVAITGKPDEVDTKYKVLVDYKSKDNLPRRPDERHEFQFNIYAWLLRGGYWVDTDEPAQIDIDVIAAHYVTFKTKPEGAWKKMAYPVWEDSYTTELVTQRLEPLTKWNTSGILPECSPYLGNPRWKCDCEKWEDQLNERGIYIE